MLVKFEKWNSCGNDFILTHCSRNDLDMWKDVLQRKAKQLCARNGTGIGADGILLVAPDPDEVVVINADGSIAKNCGNGLRAVASSIYQQETLEGLSIQLGELIFDCQFALHAGPQKYPWVVVTMPTVKDVTNDLPPALSGKGKLMEVGNRHFVIDGELPKDVENESQRLGSHFSSDVNIMWCQETQPSRNHNPLRVTVDSAFEVIPYERGVGTTAACGSGATALVSAYKMSGFLDSQAWSEVKMPGGSLFVSHSDPPQLSGPCQLVFTGDVDL